MSAQSQSRSRKIGTDYDRKHMCQYPGCAKSFTRAEHLRRHKLNREDSPFIVGGKRFREL